MLPCASGAPTLAHLCPDYAVVDAGANVGHPRHGNVRDVHPARHEPPRRAPDARPHGGRRASGNTAVLSHTHTLDRFALCTGVLNRDGR